MLKFHGAGLTDFSSGPKGHGKPEQASVKTREIRECADRRAKIVADDSAQLAHGRKARSGETCPECRQHIDRQPKTGRKDIGK